jgi:sugar phosphate isomerase/epimerase
MIKLGFVSAVVADQSFEATVDLAAEIGYDCVEMLCWPVGKAERRYAGVTHVDVAALDDDKVRHIQDYLKKRGVSISSLGYYPNYLQAEHKKGEAEVEHFLKVISASAKLGVGIATTFVGRDHTRNLEDNFARFRELWPEIVKHAEREGVRIGIENCPMFFTGDEWPGGKNLAFSPAIWRRMFNEIPSKSFGLNYDPSHMVWQQMDYIRPLYEFRERIVHAHVKDAKLLRDKLDDVGILATPLEYHTPKLPGLGEVKWGLYFSTLTDIGFEGSACVEVEDRAYEGSFAARKASLVQSHDYIRQFVPALR